MVQNENSSGSDEGSGMGQTIIPQNHAKGIPTGKYRLVGWGLDTTGSRLIDEIIQIGSYVPEEKFSQYIMPYGDINPIFSYRHGIRVVNSFRYRRLKDMNTNEYLKTKSEITALQDYLSWLEKVKASADGVILVYYEVRKISPALFVEALQRYNLLDRFSKVVKGFVNALNLVQSKCANITKSFSLKVMAKVLLNRERENFGNAVQRARASFDIVAHLAQGEREDLEKTSVTTTGYEPQVIEIVAPFANSIEVEVEEVATFKILLERQNTFRPVFGALMRSSRQERQHASYLRRLLAENNISYDKLKEAYESGAKEGLTKIIKNEIVNAKEDELEELLNILDCFFDPEKKAVQPKRAGNNYRRRNRSFNRKRNSKSGTRSPNASNSTTPRSEGEKIETQTAQPQSVPPPQEPVPVAVEAQ